MEVSDRIIDLALVIFMEGYDRSYDGLYKLEPISGKDLQGDMKAALEAVFDHIEDNLEKVEPEDTRDAKWNKCKKEILDAAKEAHYKKAYNHYLDLNDVPQNPNRIKPNIVKPEPLTDQEFDNMVREDRKKQKEATSQKKTLVQWAYCDIDKKSPGFRYITKKYGGLISLLSEYSEYLEQG